MRTLFHYWNLLIEPATTITDNEERQRVRFFSASLAFLILLVSVFTIITNIAIEKESILPELSAITIVGIIYLLSRSRYYQIAVIGFIIFLSAFFFVMIYTSKEIIDLTIIFYFVIPVLVAGLMFNIRGLVVTTLIIIVTSFVFASFLDHDALLPLTVNNSFVLFVVAIFVGYYARVQQKIRQDLQESEARFRQLIHGVDDGVWDWRAGEDVHYYSPRYMEMLGYEPNEFPHIDEEWRKRIHPEDRERVITISNRCIDGEVDSFSIEYRLQHKDGSWRWILGRGSNVRDEQGRVYRVIGTHTDITERKQLEDQKVELAIERQRMHLLTEFITLSSHEFRTPLASINTSAFLLNKATNEDKKEDHLANIQMQVSNISRLVNTLNTMVKLDSLETLSLTKTDVAQLVKMITTSVQQKLLQKSLQWEVNTHNRPLFIQVDTPYFQQALVEITDNAIQYTPVGGKITLEARQDNTSVIITVSDTGSGIEKESIPHIFEPFYRSDATGTTRGFGLGLPIAKKIIELHHGHIEVESSLGKGTIIRVILPA